MIQPSSAVVLEWGPNVLKAVYRPDDGCFVTAVGYWSGTRPRPNILTGHLRRMWLR